MRIISLIASSTEIVHARPGPRTVESLEILAELIHPDHFNFGHEGQGWVAL